jgi:hypothetical protein
MEKSEKAQIKFCDGLKQKSEKAKRNQFQKLDRWISIRLVNFSHQTNWILFSFIRLIFFAVLAGHRFIMVSFQTGPVQINENLPTFHATFQTTLSNLSSNFGFCFSFHASY